MRLDGWGRLAWDLASFHNVKPEDAEAALDAARAGDSAPLRRFGIHVTCPPTLDEAAAAVGPALGDFDRSLR